MPALSYVGRNPSGSFGSTPSALATKADTDTQAATAVVDSTYVTSEINAAIPPTQTKAYVDAQDATRAQKTAVTLADNNYLATTVKAAPNGVASLDSSGSVFTAQLPSGIPADRVATSYCLSSTALWTGSGTAVISGAGVTGINFLSGGLTHTCTTSGTTRDFMIAKIVVPDPGWPWKPIPFAFVRGTGVSNPTDPSVGNGCFGLLTVMAPVAVNNFVYGLGLGYGFYDGAAGTPSNWLTVLPSALVNQTATSVPPLTGSVEMGLYANCQSGAGYTYYGDELAYQILVVPAL